MPPRPGPSPGGPSPRPAQVAVRRTPRGWRLTQHGTVLSEVLTLPGPTHSVFDLLAAACLLHPRPRHIALLGFGGGSVVAALRALRCNAHVHAADLDATGLDLLRGAGAHWLEPLSCRIGDAVPWLRHARRAFDVIVEDLSVPSSGDVRKPDATWEILPDLVADRLAPAGLAVFNLLRPPGLSWPQAIPRVTSRFRHALDLTLGGFENRIILASNLPLPARPSGERLRKVLHQLGSTQAGHLTIAQAVRPLPA